MANNRDAVAPLRGAVQLQPLFPWGSLKAVTLRAFNALGRGSSPISRDYDNRYFTLITAVTRPFSSPLILYSESLEDDKLPIALASNVVTELLVV